MLKRRGLEGGKRGFLFYFIFGCKEPRTDWEVLREQVGFVKARFPREVCQLIFHIERSETHLQRIWTF